MKKIMLSFLVVWLMVIPVRGIELEVSDFQVGEYTYNEDELSSFWGDLRDILGEAVINARPDLAEAVRTCICVIGIVLLCSVTLHYTEGITQTVQLALAVSVGILLLNSGKSLIELGMETVRNISEHSKVILPVLTGSLAAQGGTTKSIALHTGTAIFSTVLSVAVSKLLVPLLYCYLCLGIACSVLSEETLKHLRDFTKWILTWGLKIVLYLFTGYMSISGVISGTVDASALKMTKLAISGSVPVVGNILSDASETILLSAGVMKNSAGAYGLAVLAAIFLGPFIKIGIHYVLLKVTAAICSVFSNKETSGLVFTYANGMGFVLAMTGVSCLLSMISIVSYMKGVG